MSDILYERSMPTGAIVRIRRITAVGESPVRGVVEVDRRSGVVRPSGVVHTPPPLLQVEGDSEGAVKEALLPFAEDDSAVARLLAQRGR